MKEANENVDTAESSYEEKYLEAKRTEQNVKSMEAKVKELIKLTDISSQESFQIHALNNAVRDVISTGTRIFSLSRDKFTCSQRGGISDWTIEKDELANCQALFSQRENTVLVGTLSEYIFELDLTNKGKILRKVKTEEGGVTLFRTTPSNSR